MDLLRQTRLSAGYRRALRLLGGHLREGGCETLSNRELAALLWERRVRTLLEIGPGNCAFLRLLAPTLRDAGVEAFAVGLALEPMAQRLLDEQGIHAVREDACELGRALGSRTFDLIVAVGVLSLATVMSGLPDGADRVRVAAERHLHLLRSSLARLSDHPGAAFVACSPITFLILDRREVEEHARVLAWEMEEHKRRPEWFQMQTRRFAQAYTLDGRELRSYGELWQTSADGAILGHLGRSPAAGAEPAPRSFADPAAGGGRS